MDFDVWAFLYDDAFWDWFRPLAAALLGALVGGAFTILAQRAQGERDRIAQAERDKAVDERQAAMIAADRASRLRAETMRDVRGLVKIFASVHRVVQQYDGVQSVTKNPERHPVVVRWDDEIWSVDRSLHADILSLTILDETTRNDIRRCIRALDYAPEFTGSGQPDPATFTLHRVAGQVTTAALELLGSHLRGEAPSRDFEDMLLLIELHREQDR